jgi:hypothetical protein
VARAPFLHVANGTSTTDTIEAAGIPGLRSIWADPLYDGPVPAELNDDELLEVRRRHLAGEDADRATVWAGPDPSADPVNDLREWRAALAGYESYEELVLWFEHDIFDQLNLIHVLTWIREHLPADRPVSLVCIGSFPGRPNFKGLGELTPAELASLLETRQRVSGGQYELARRAWLAFRAPTPDALDALRDDDTSALPYLAPAVDRFLQEYPSTRNGLSRTEQRLLELADGGGIAVLKAFPRMHDGERFYHVTGASVAEMATDLAHTVPPLLTLDLSRVEPGNPLPGVIALTDAGRSVLSGDRDRIATCGIDRWLGGVHLETGTRLWRWDDGRHRLVADEGGVVPARG